MWMADPVKSGQILAGIRLILAGIQLILAKISFNSVTVA
jgi:hypothetical protein